MAHGSEAAAGYGPDRGLSCVRDVRLKQVYIRYRSYARAQTRRLTRPLKPELLPRRNIALSGARKASGKDAKGTPATAAMLPDGPVLLVVGDQVPASHSPPLDAPCGVCAVVEGQTFVVTCAPGRGLRERYRRPDLGGWMASGCKAAREARMGGGRTPAALGIMRFISAPDA